jgi:single-strand DNA-binding protein
MNKAIIYGNLTRDVELRSLPGGGPVASFGVATNRRVKKGEQWEDVPEFHNVVVFGRQAETTAQYLAKGDTVLLEGRIQTRSWESPEKGKQFRTEIVAERVQFGQRKDGARAERKPKEEKPAEVEDHGIEYPTEDINPDDIPF